MCIHVCEFFFFFANNARNFLRCFCFFNLLEFFFICCILKFFFFLLPFFFQVFRFSLLQQATTTFFLLFYLQRGSGRRFEHLANAFFTFGRALEIGECVYFLGHGTTLFRLHWFLFHFIQLSDGDWVVS